MRTRRRSFRISRAISTPGLEIRTRERLYLGFFSVKDRPERWPTGSRYRRQIYAAVIGKTSGFVARRQDTKRRLIRGNDKTGSGAITNYITRVGNRLVALEHFESGVAEVTPYKLKRGLRGV